MLPRAETIDFPVPLVPAAVTEAEVCGLPEPCAGTLAVPDVSGNIVAGQGLKQSYSFVLVAVNHNIVRIAGGALGFPVL